MPWSAEIAEQAVPILHRMDQRLFRLDALDPTNWRPGSARRAGEADRSLLLDWYQAFAEEAEARGHGPERSVDRMARSRWRVDLGRRRTGVPSRTPGAS